MRDTEFYQRILGLVEPWYVERVELRVAEHRVDIHLAHRQGVKWPCPQCGQEMVGYDHAPERQWRHLDTCQFQTVLHACVPRGTCGPLRRPRERAMIVWSPSSLIGPSSRAEYPR